MPARTLVIKVTAGKDEPERSGQALNVAGASLTNGAPVIQWPYSANTTYNDEWQILGLP